ncbi:hypothetical protein STANM309S_01367 [Streptomyces tanashiensis]
MVSSSGAPIRVKRLQKPQRTSQNGMCAYRERASFGSPAQSAASSGRSGSERYAVLCG